MGAILQQARPLKAPMSPGQQAGPPAARAAQVLCLNEKRGLRPSKQYNMRVLSFKQHTARWCKQCLQN